MIFRLFPLSVFFPLIGSILSILDLLLKSATRRHIANLHVVVAEDIRIDRSITQSGLFDDASYLHGFTGDLDLMYKEEEPTVWIPILGEGQEKQIELIESFGVATRKFVLFCHLHQSIREEVTR